MSVVKMLMFENKKLLDVDYVIVIKLKKVKFNIIKWISLVKELIWCKLEVIFCKFWVSLVEFIKCLFIFIDL